MKKMYLFLFVAILAGSLARAATYSWTATTGNWNTGANWTNTADNSTGVVPSAIDDVIFANNATATVTLDFASSTTVRSITIGSGTTPSNVIFSSGSGGKTINIAGPTTNCLVIPSGRALTLQGAVSAAGVVLNIQTGNTCTINGTLNLAVFGNSTTLQVNQFLAVDASSVTVASGGVINYNVNNNSSTLPFGTAGTNSAIGAIIFQSGSTFTAYSSGNAFGNNSDAGIPTFQSGSTVNVFGGSGLGAVGNGNNCGGRTFGKLVVGNGTSSTAITNNSTTNATTFLDSLVVSSGAITLTGNATANANPTFNIKNIRISTATTAAVSLVLRTNPNASAPNTYYEIGGTVQVIAAASSTTGTATLTLGPNAVGGTSSVSHTNITFTGANSSLQQIKQSGGTGYPNIVIGAPSGLSGTGVLPTNIIVANNASLALGDSLTLRTGTQSYTSFTIRPTGRLTLTDNATLTTNNNGYAIIESDATGTGTIGTVVGKLINGFIVKRYIPANAAWRTIGLPFNTVTYSGATAGSSTVDLSYFVSGRTNPWAYYYNEAADNGLYGTTSGVNAGWTAITSSTTGLGMRNGLLLYGSKNQSAYTLSDTGFINYGDQVISLSKTVNGWNLIANPYPSNISFTSIVNNGSNSSILTSNTVYRVRPLGNGAYSWASYVSGSGTGSNGGSDVIENGAAFFVQAAANATNLTIKETDKTTNAVSSTSGGVSLMGANDNYNAIRLNLTGANTFSDEVVFVWGRFSKATDAFDADFDAYDLGASGTHDLSIVGNDDTRYAIFNGSDLSKTAETRIYKLGVKSLRTGTYTFTASMPKDLDRNNEAYLVDKFLNKATLVKEGMQVSFDVTADAASKAEDRFQLEVRKKLVSVADQIASSKTYLLSNPISNNQFAIHFGSDAEVANWQVVDLSGRVISTGVFKNVYQGDTRVAELKALQSGTYLVRLFNDNEQTAVMKLVKL